MTNFLKANWKNRETKAVLKMAEGIVSVKNEICGSFEWLKRKR